MKKLELSQEDILSSITSDLVSLEEYESFVRRLTTFQQGCWVHLDEMGDSQQVWPDELQLLEKSVKDSFVVTWLKHPDISSKYCLVIFYSEILDWTNVATYNRQVLANEFRNC